MLVNDSMLFLVNQSIHLKPQLQHLWANINITSRRKIMYLNYVHFNKEEMKAYRSISYNSKRYDSLLKVSKMNMKFMLFFENILYMFLTCMLLVLTMLVLVYQSNICYKKKKCCYLQVSLSMHLTILLRITKNHTQKRIKNSPHGGQT